MSVKIAWIVLIIAGLLEVGWSTGLKYTKGFTVLIPSVFTIMAMVVSMYLLGKATNVLPIGTAYSIWVGIGALGASILGIVLFGESVNPMKVICLLMLIASIIGLKVFSN